MATGTDYANGTMGDLLDSLIAGAFEYTRNERTCAALPDRDLVREGILRVLSQVDSGRDWLQKALEKDLGVATRGTFFPALQSERRRQLVEDIAVALTRRAGRELADLGVDHLAAFPELAPYRCLAADGHTVKHASHAEPRPSGNHNPVSCIYALDLRSGLARMPRNLRHLVDLPILHPKQAHVLPDRFAFCGLRLLFGRLAACEGRGGELASLPKQMHMGHFIVPGVGDVQCGFGVVGGMGKHHLALGGGAVVEIHVRERA